MAQALLLLMVSVPVIAVLMTFPVWVVLAAFVLLQTVNWALLGAIPWFR